MGRNTQSNVIVDASNVALLDDEIAAEPTMPMFNGIESVRADPIARRFEIGEILFAEFSCPAEKIGLWTETDYLMHVLTGTARWRTAAGLGSASAGETVFFKKGAHLLPEHAPGILCVQLYFIPDACVKDAVMHLTADLPAIGDLASAPAPLIRLMPDIALSAFLQAMRVYFASDQDPPARLLKLKLDELLASLLLSRSNPALCAHFQSIAACDAPPIPSIMEENFHYNLPLETFAQMCHRSLSSFKRDFRKHYGTSPGKWLMERRLARAVSLMQTTHLNITAIMLECGFVDASHFSKAFKEKFGQPPSVFRESMT